MLPFAVEDAKALEPGDVLIPALWFVGALLLLALIVFVVQRWQRRTRAGGDSVHDHLALFREMYEQGELSPEEYERVHQKLAGKIREQPKPASPESPAKSAEPPQDDSTS